MNYDAIIARQQTILQGLSVLGSSNVVIGDPRVLDTGLDRMVILWPGEATIPDGEMLGGDTFGDPDYTNYKPLVEWVTKVEMWQRFTTDAASWTNHFTFRMAVLAIMIGSPSLTSTALSTLDYLRYAKYGGVLEAAQLMYRENGGGPHWIKETFSWLAAEWVTVNVGQYA